MSWWTDFRDSAEKAVTFGFYDPEKSREEDRERRSMIADQIKAYKDQTEITNQQLNEAREATSAEKRRIDEKQIRALRRSYRPATTGFLGSGSPATTDMNQKLGG